MRLYELVPNRIAYRGAPQCASKTMLGYLYTLKYGSFPEGNRPLEYIRDKIILNEDLNRDRWRIEKEFLNYPIRICIVRDPIERFLNIYAAQLNTPQCKRKDISLEESLQSLSIPDFVEENVKFSNQSKTQVHFYGRDPSIYTHIFNINRMNEVRELIERESGVSISPLHLHKTKEEKIPKQLTKEQETMIRNRYKQDYEIYGKWM